jgi:hypothetical protein
MVATRPPSEQRAVSVGVRGALARSENFLESTTVLKAGGDHGLFPRLLLRILHRTQVSFDPLQICLVLLKQRAVHRIKLLRVR